MAGAPIPRLVSDSRFLREIDSRAASIADPAEKLRFLRREMRPRPPRRHVRLSLVASIAAALTVPFAAWQAVGSAAGPALPKPAPAHAKTSHPGVPGSIWLVEEKNGTEFYSNGLRVERRLEVSTRPRQYRVLDRASGKWSAGDRPAGIVFHTTESLVPPFTADHNDALKQAAKGILSYVRERELYNFVIDRFGRVFRLVKETDAAYHAGHSLWADAGRVFIDLNDSFLGVSFEAQSAPSSPSWTAAQANAARLLVEMLRAKYGIGAENCVTHAQVSVNPANMQLGYHTDWATGFPYAELGLRDLYQEPNPAVALFGFGYGPDLIAAIGGKPWPGLVSAELQTVQAAASAGQTTAVYRKLLRDKYRKNAQAARNFAASRERNHNES